MNKQDRIGLHSVDEKCNLKYIVSRKWSRKQEFCVVLVVSGGKKHFVCSTLENLGYVCVLREVR